MTKSVFAVGISAALFSTLTFGAPFPHPETSTVPLLSGTYVITERRFCQQSMAVTATSGNVTNIKMTGKTDSLSVGTVKFKQGSKAGAGTLSITETTVDGSPVLPSGSSTSGSSSSNLQTSTGTESATFKQTATTFSFSGGGDSDSYTVYYGKVTGGVAQFAAFAGIDDDGCADQGTLTIE